jgi:glycosyltransferase involved in cell wall biosynthesis
LIDEAKVPGFREDMGVRSEDLLVTLVAQLVPWKRHDLFIEAAAQLLSRRSDLHFLIVGSDPWGLNRAYQKMLVERANEPRLAGRVRFLGQRNDVGTILAASDIAVLPSENEPFDRVLVESWWAGTPVVATNQGGPAEIIEDGVTGLLFHKGDAKDLARQMERLPPRFDLRAPERMAKFVSNYVRLSRR